MINKEKFVIRENIGNQQGKITTTIKTNNTNENVILNDKLLSQPHSILNSNYLYFLGGFVVAEGARRVQFCIYFNR